MPLPIPIYRLKHRAKLLARREGIALHEALDRVARAQGFARWSLLTARVAAAPPAQHMLSRLSDGDLLLLGARPGHGKTMLGLRLLLDAVADGRRAHFFTLEYSPQEAAARIRSLGRTGGGRGGEPEVVTSDAISAGFIVEHLAGAAQGTLALVDYLQLLDQQRSKPSLAEQIVTLRDFARRTGVVFAFLAQIDRAFDPQHKPVPDIRDVRLPNPLDLGLFSKTCFLHNGTLRFQ